MNTHQRIIICLSFVFFVTSLCFAQPGFKNDFSEYVPVYDLEEYKVYDIILPAAGMIAPDKVFAVVKFTGWSNDDNKALMQAYAETIKEKFSLSDDLWRDFTSKSRKMAEFSDNFHSEKPVKLLTRQEWDDFFAEDVDSCEVAREKFQKKTGATIVLQLSRAGFSLNKNKAMAEITVHQSCGQPVMTTYFLQKENGLWKIKSSLSSAGMY